MSFTFNGINSDAMGLFVERYPSRPFPTRKSNVYQIAGRSGDLVIDQYAFSNVTQEYEVFVNGNMQTRLQNIAQWLLSVGGYAVLTDSYDSSTYRNARFIGGESFFNSLNKYGKATIQFDCCPQRYPLVPETVTETFGNTITIPTHDGMMNGYPLITIPQFDANNSGTIDTGSLLITIPAQGSNAGTITIDFETHVIKSNRLTLSAVTAVGTWTALGNGDSIITTLTNGDPQTISVNPRRWYL